MSVETASWSNAEEQLVRQQLSRVLQSLIFVHADRLGRFLSFVVEATLEGRGQRLNQFAIAIDVFDRDESFDPTVDAIVRVEAGRLRSKLLEYYDELGSGDPVRILLPKRSYLATFQFQAETGTSAPSATTGLDKPTIAVLPFQNMSTDPEQEYFADGITEDLITDLSQLPGVSVISRQSMFSYKGTTTQIQQVCEELGATIVLEGSVRKMGNRVRITAQLIEGVSAQHLWAQRYDRDTSDIFEIQDEVNHKIVEALRLQLSDSERQKLGNRGTDVIDAYDYVLRGMKETQLDTMEGSARARYCFERALELDSHYAAAYARLAFNYVFRWILNWDNSREDSLDKGYELASKAVDLDGRLALAHAALCWAHVWRGDHDKAIAEGRLAVELDPCEVLALERLALSMIWAGEVDAALPLIDEAKRLNPGETYDFPRGTAMFIKGDYEEAIKFLSNNFERNPKFIPAGLYLAASQALSGQQKEAAATIRKITQISPNFKTAGDFPVHFKNAEDRDRLHAGLGQAGLA